MSVRLLEVDHTGYDGCFARTERLSEELRREIISCFCRTRPGRTIFTLCATLPAAGNSARYLMMYRQLLRLNQIRSRRHLCLHFLKIAPAFSGEMTAALLEQLEEQFDIPPGCPAGNPCGILKGGRFSGIPHRTALISCKSSSGLSGASEQRT